MRPRGVTTSPMSSPTQRRAPRGPAPTSSGDADVRRILLATEGRPLTNAVIAHAMNLAKQHGASVRVLAIARVHGVALGMPNPGLLPTKREWAEREQTVMRAIKRLRRKGIDADGQVVGTRKGAQRICEEADQAGCDIIVMGADAARNRLIGELYWSQEPQRVHRQARVPVHLIEQKDSGAAS